MSFFTGKKASFKRSTSFFFKKSIFILVAVVCCIQLCFPMSIYAESSVVSASKKMFHKHTGSAESGGGCYSIEKTGTRMEKEKCGGAMTYWPDLGTTSCSKCGASYFGDESGRECYYYIEVPMKYYYYELGCGKNTTSAIGTLTVTKNTEDWAKSVVLTGAYENKGGLGVGSNAYIWNGESATNNNTYEVTTCGTYSLSLNVKSKANVTGNKVTIEVQNVDHTSPTVTVSYDKETLAKAVDVVVSATDLQPDGTVGCGLHETPYSFDGGNTWTANSVYTVTKNGTLKIAVRDRLENVTNVENVITNIDRTGPVISYKLEPSVWTNGNVKIHLSAKDEGDGGGNAVGLPKEWYSIDGGKKWNHDFGFTVTENQTITVWARDLLGNQTQEKITVSHIDKEAPKVDASVKISGENGQKAMIQIEASDTGAGLHDTAYSWDNGESYTVEKTSFVTKNGIYFVWIRDKVGNVAKESVEVDVLSLKTDEHPIIEPEEGSEEEESSTPVSPEPEEEGSVSEDEPESETEEESSEEESSTESENESEEETTEERTTEYETIEETTEETTEETIVLLDELVDEPTPLKMQEVKENPRWTVGEIVAFMILLLALLLLFLFLFLLWGRTIAIYAKNNDGEMEYKGRTWIHNREARYEVDVEQKILDQCETTYLRFCPSLLFAKLHEEEEIHFLFPDGVCVTLPIAQKIEME